jgi:hypothetical protein
MKIRDAAKRFEAYDRATTKKMAQYNKANNGDVRAPVRSLKGASTGDKYDRAKFIYRKAAQALTAGHPLKDKNGEATPAALQFKRWAAKVPQDREDLQELKALGARLKARHKPKS